MAESESARPGPDAGPPAGGTGPRPYRPQRLAVATESGVNIDGCFGRVENFRIYRLVSGDGPPRYEFEESRPGPRPCRERTHDLAVLDRTAELLADCGLVLAGRIGPAAVKVLTDRGILGLATSLPLEDALRRLAGDRSQAPGA